MNICFFTGDMSDGGGTEHMTQLLANQLSLDDNYKVCVLSKSQKKQRTFFALSENVKLDVLDVDKYRGVYSVIKDIFLLKKYIKKNKIDILINVDVSLGVFSLPLAILCPKLKQLFWEHFSFHYNIGSKRTLLFRKLALKLANAYVTLTPEDTVEFDLLVKKHCLIVDIPNISAIEKSSNQYDVFAKKIVSVGNLHYIKGFDLAILASEKVFKRHPDWIWELYGDGVEFENLQKLAKERNITNNFIFKGRTNDLNSAYKDASIFVLSSRSEGFGLVLIEAQAYHLPLVAFDVPYGPCNIIKDNTNGYLVKPFDIDDMANKICNLIENTELRKNFSENATVDLYKYSAAKIALKWKKLLGEI